MTRAATLAVPGATALLAALVLRYLLPDAVVGAIVVGLLGAGLVALAVALDFRRVRRALASPRGVARTGAAVRGSLLIAAVVAANVVAGAMGAHLDLTARSELSLSAQTRSALADIRQPAEATLLFTADAPPQVAAHARDLLAEYRHVFPRLTVREADPIANPELARRYRLDEAAIAAGVVVFTGTRGRAFVAAPQIAQGAEAAFTSALLQVSGRRLPVVYFATGNGEQGPENGYGRAAAVMADALFTVREVDLRTAARVPADAAALLVVGPAAPLGLAETRLLGDYLDGGGRLLLGIDPDPDASVRAFLQGRGIEVRGGTIADPLSHAEPNASDVLVPADRTIFGVGPVRFPGLALVRPSLDLPDSVHVTALGMTSDQAGVVPAEGRGRRTGTGSLPIGILASTSAAATGEQRLAVLGDTDFASDGNIADGAAAALFATTVKWLAAGHDVLPIAPRTIGERRFLVSPEQARFIGLSSIALLPALVLAIGAFLWWRR